MLRGVVACLVVAASFAFSSSQVLGADPVSLRFDITAYRVEGSTLLTNNQVQSAVAPFRRKQRDFADIQRALEALETAYRKAGFGAVQVFLPEQELQGGIVVLRVVEWRIGKVEITGNKHFDSGNIRRSLPALKEGQTPNSRALADNLRVANESPVKQARVVLRPSSKPNEVDAKVEVEDESPWRVFSTLDNTGTKQTGRTRLGVGLQHANLFNRDHVATAQMPAGPLQFSGQGTVYGARNFLFARHGEYENKMVFGADYRIYDNVCSVGAFGAAGNNAECVLQ